ncbi:MAG: LysE family translocator [Cryobacterium sp.]|nr:LysE family translocator [Cryobacterium sp.]MBX3116981.1 LysE family translocator [Cryobacterium sp.]MCO5293627.1 LysE family translocator [Homoserinimonas sp.]MCW5944778.1 LysE family translocator [Cryobacterium sp.]
MIPVSNLVAFGLLCIPIIVIPGPSVLFTIGRSLALGRFGGLLSVLGNVLGAVAITIAIAFGVGALLEGSDVVFFIVKLLGAAYLIYLGIQSIRHRKQKADAATGEFKKRGNARTVWEAFVVGITNAKSILFMVAVLPLFVEKDQGNIWLQILLLGSVFVVIALVSDSAWALAAGTARDWFAKSPKRIETLAAIGGSLMIVLGLILALLPH